MSIPADKACLQFHLTGVEIFKVANNIKRFEPGSIGSHDTAAYLKDLNFQLRSFPNATVEEKIDLIRLTSDRMVYAFIERQSDATRNDYNLLCDALIKEFTRCIEPSGYLAAVKVMHGKDEHPLVYYDRIFQAYFGRRNEPGMDEEVGFKFVFTKNLNSDIKPSVQIRAHFDEKSIKEIKQVAVNVFDSLKQVKTPLQVRPGEMVNSHSLKLDGERAPAPPPQKGEKKLDFQSNKSQLVGARWYRTDPKWFSSKPEGEHQPQKGGARPKTEEDADHGPAPPAPRTAQFQMSRKSQKFQKQGPKPLSSDETETPRSLLVTLSSTDKDDQPDTLCSNTIANESEHTYNNVDTVADSCAVADSHQDLVVTDSESPSSHKRGVNSHINNEDPLQTEHSDAAATALKVRMDQNYTERGKYKQKRWLKPIRLLCNFIKGIPTSAHGLTSSPRFMVRHDHRGVMLVHAHDTFVFPQKNLEKTADGRKAYYDQKASHEEPQLRDKVWYYTFAPTTGKRESETGTLARKLMPRWTGPHLITDKLSSVVYQIKINKGHKQPIVKWVHRNQVKPHKVFNNSTGDKDLTNSDLVGKRVVQAETK